MKNKTKVMNLKMDPQLYADFFQATKDEAAMHAFEYAGAATVLRTLMREYVVRVRSVQESANGKLAAKVLRRAVRS